MARYKVILAYDGTHFSGSQRQADARTVQHAFETALRKLEWSEKSVLLAGRTDAGVHAGGQVAAFNLDWDHPPQALMRALNALLPKDVAVRTAETCPEDFHPRFDAIWRSYRYQIISDPVRDPLQERFCWRIWPGPDFDLLETEARALIGTFDFSPFGRPTRPDGSTVREVRRANWQRQGRNLTFEVTANAFLYHMVRRMVSVQVSIAQGSLEPGSISRALRDPQGHPIFQGLAPSQGLSLTEVRYP